MNYSKALNECIESAYMVASHFGARYLESWHLLIAMSNHSYSVAGATLNDYPYEMDRLEEVALELTETDYSQDETFTARKRTRLNSSPIYGARKPSSA